MIGDWFVQLPALIAAVVTVFVPGLLIGTGLRLRGLMLWALAPIGSTALLALLAIAYGAVGLTWSPLTAAVGCLTAAVVTWVAAIPLRRAATPARPPRSETFLLAAGLTLGVVIGGLRVGFYIGAPAAISQTNDAVYHLNTIRYIAETGSASSFDLTGMLGSAAFYPGAWHAITSLVALATGGGIPVAATMVSLVIAAAIWPLGLTWLVRTTTMNPSTTAFAAALSPALLAFPMLMLEWGVLYPYALSVALLPAAASVVVGLPSWRAAVGPEVGRAPFSVVAVALILATVCALALSQPATLLAWAILVAVWFSFWMGRRVRRSESGLRRIAIASLGAVWIGFVVLWILLSRSTAGAHWAPFEGKARAVVDVLVNAPVALPAAVGISILMAAGLVVAVRTGALRWLAVSWLVFAGLYAATAAVGNPSLRRWLLGAWYADPYRLAALLPVVVIPLAAIGLAAIVRWAAMAIGAERRDRTAVSGGWTLAVIGGIGAVSLLVAPVVQMPKIVEGGRDTVSRYTSDGLAFLSPDERALLSRLDTLVPADARVIGNPSTGMGFGYMLSGRDLYPRTWATPRTEEWSILAESLRDAGTDPTVCEALGSYGNAEYVLDFGPGEATPGRFIAPGMTGFEGQPGFELVAREGDASLWRITACR